MNEKSGAGENKNNSRPKKSPSHDPLAAPVSAARPYVSRPVMRSTVVRSVPTIARCLTGNSAFASLSTVSWAA